MENNFVNTLSSIYSQELTISGKNIKQNERNTLKASIMEAFSAHLGELFSGSDVLEVGVTTDGKDEIYEGTYRNDYVTEKNEKGESVNVGYRLTLYYDNKPDEFQGIFGYPKYDLTLDGSTLTRLQHQVGGSTNRIIRQTFVKSK